MVAELSGMLTSVEGVGIDPIAIRLLGVVQELDIDLHGHPEQALTEVIAARR